MTWRKFRLLLMVLNFCTVVTFMSHNCLAQAHQDSILKQIAALRDDYIGKIKENGYRLRLEPPQIVLDNPPSFGNYDEHNIIHMSDWLTLPADSKEAFNGFAALLGHGTTGEQFFNMAVYKWIFIHELSHWWRDCRQQKSTPYNEEKDADRLASAYWNDRDPLFYRQMLTVFNGVVNHNLSPVPTGKNKEKYFNENYSKLPGGPAYSWYQSIMIVEVGIEKPLENFRQAVNMAGKPLMH